MPSKAPFGRALRQHVVISRIAPLGSSTNSATAYQAAPLKQYRSLAAWVEEEAKNPIEQPTEPNSPLGEARDLEVTGNRTQEGPNSGTDPHQMEPALARLSDAIHLLDAQSLGRPLGRRETDMLIELLLRRGDWKLSSKDFGGALQDAQWVLDIDEKVAEAHRLRGDAFVAAG